MDGEVAAYNPRDGKRRLFKFDRVFGPEASQTGVYEDTSALIRSVLDGEAAPDMHALHCTLHAFQGCTVCWLAAVAVSNAVRSQ